MYSRRFSVDSRRLSVDQRRFARADKMVREAPRSCHRMRVGRLAARYRHRAQDAAAERNSRGQAPG
eukprot:3003131-Pyramimonas_sp.AAC.1